MIKTILNGEYEIILPKHRADRKEWHSENGWEKKRLQEIKKTIKQGDQMFYIGAEEGDMCALCQMWGAKMTLFEPNPKVIPNIKAIWDANGLTPPNMFVGFASNKSTGEIVQTGFPECANGEVIGDHGFMELQNHNAPEIKIDDIETKPDIISIDVEGSEWEVLRGAEQTLRTKKPIIFLSLHPEFLFRIYGEYAFDLRTWIKNIGYRETLLDYQHEVHIKYETI